MDENVIEENLLRKEPIFSTKYSRQEDPKPESDTASETSRHDEGAKKTENMFISRHEKTTKEWEGNAPYQTAHTKDASWTNWGAGIHGWKLDQIQQEYDSGDETDKTQIANNSKLPTQTADILTAMQIGKLADEKLKEKSIDL